MSDDKKKPAQLTHNTQIDIQTLAAALRLAVDPIETAKNQRLQEVAGKDQVRIPAISPTGARFVLVIEEGRNYKTKALEQVIKTIEDYEYPWSAELEAAAPAYRPELRWWKNPDPNALPYSWGDRSFDSVVHPTTHQLTRDCKQKLYEDTWQADLRVYIGMTVAQGSMIGLREVKQPAATPSAISR